MMTLFDRFEKVVGGRPGATALVAGETACTYDELLTMATRAAEGLRNAGLRPGESVVFSDPLDTGYVAMVLACSATGVTFVPVNHLAPDAWRARIGAKTGSRASFRSLEDIGRVPVAAAGSEAVDALTVLCTSGTTGDPKAVCLSQAACLSGVDNAAAEINLEPDDLVLNYIPPHLVGGMYILILPALLTGGAVLLERFEPYAFTTLVAERRPTVTILVPAMLQAARRTKAWATLDLSCFKVVISGATVVPDMVPKEVLERKARSFRHFYGLTECLTPVLSNVTSDPYDTGATGFRKVCDSYECRLVDDELQIRGPGMFTRYLGDVERTDAILDNGWLRTGDRFRREGETWWFEGRSDDVLMVNGMTVGPVLTEKVVAELPGAGDVCVVKAVRRSGAEELVALYEGDAVAPEDVLAICRARLDVHQQPKRATLVTGLPRNSMGKVDRAAARVLFANGDG